MRHIRSPVRTLDSSSSCTSSSSGTDHYTFWNDRVRRGNLECALQETNNAQDGNHHENTNEPPEHDLETFVRVLAVDAKEVLNETPEEKYDGKGDEEPDNAVQEGREE